MVLGIAATLSVGVRNVQFFSSFHLLPLLGAQTPSGSISLLMKSAAAWETVRGITEAAILIAL